MEKVNTIVVPVDFSKSTEKLVEYALYMASQLAAAPHFVHIVDYYRGDAMLGVPYVLEVNEKLQTDAKTRMSNLLNDNKKKCPECTGEVATGDPVDKIVAIAEERNCDLIIISTHGAKGLEKILLGSVAERVLKRAHCPVLIMNPFKK